MTELRRDPHAYKLMRRTAGGLLAGMGGLYVGAHLFLPPDGPGGYVRAFAEAGLVGGLADWFAVTALFRRPLGLPIPHTGIIPRRHGDIAVAVGGFIREHFLNPELVEARVAGADLAEGLSRQLMAPGQIPTLARGLTALVPPLLETLEDKEIAAFLRERAEDRAGGGQLAPLLASILETLAQQGHHQRLLDGLVKEGFVLLEEHEALIRSKVRETTGWFWRLIRLDQRTSQSLIQAVEDLLSDIANNRDHPLRTRISQTVAAFADDLREDRDIQKRLDAWVRETLSHPEVASGLKAGWIETRSAIARDCEADESRIRSWIETALGAFARDLTHRREVRDALNRRLRPMIVDLARRHGEDVARFLADTIRGWGGDALASTLEAHVGRDLQFIRINGTLIGGLIGLALHAASGLIPQG